MNTYTQEQQDLLEKNKELRTKCTVYTRVMGYHRPVETFNSGKQGEFKERVHFIEPSGVKEDETSKKSRKTA